jgi:hypothetical protein
VTQASTHDTTTCKHTAVSTDAAQLGSQLNQLTGSCCGAWAAGMRGNGAAWNASPPCCHLHPTNRAGNEARAITLAHTLTF